MLSKPGELDAGITEVEIAPSKGVGGGREADFTAGIIVGSGETDPAGDTNVRPSEAEQGGNVFQVGLGHQVGLNGKNGIDSMLIGREIVVNNIVPKVAESVVLEETADGGIDERRLEAKKAIAAHALAKEEDGVERQGVDGIGVAEAAEA